MIVESIGCKLDIWRECGGLGAGGREVGFLLNVVLKEFLILNGSTAHLSDNLSSAAHVPTRQKLSK